MAIKVYSLEQSEQWDAIVSSFEKYDVYWLSGYVKAFNIHGDGEPILISYEGVNTRGINVVMKRDVSRDERFSGKIAAGTFWDFTTPYGYGGWIIEGEDSDKLFDEYHRWACDNNIISEFVRFHPIIKNHDKCRAFYDVIGLGEVVHMDLSSSEVIWNNIISKNRNMIRKAVKNDVKVYNGRFPEIYDKFMAIYNTTMDRDDAQAYYYFGKEFYQSILEDLSENAQVFWAEKDREVIAAAIMIYANGRMNYHLSGSLKEFGTLAPTNLILYKAALWGCANGYKTLLLGGGVGSAEDSLFKFKRAFYKGDLNRFYIGKKIYSEEKYNYLSGLRESDDVGRSGFFPQYRA